MEVRSANRHLLVLAGGSRRAGHWAPTAGSRDTSRRSGCRRPGRGRGSARRSGGMGGRPGGRRGSRRGRPSSESRISRAAASSTAWSCSSGVSRAARQGETLRLPERLRLPLVPDPGDEALVEDRVADCAPWSPRRMRAAISSSRGGRSRMSGPSRGMPRAWSSSTGPFHCRASTLRAAEDEPRAAAARSAPRGHERPAAVHPQVAAQDVAALEAEQQVLAHRLDREQTAAVELLGDPADLRARVRRLHLDLLADERLEAPRGAMEGVSFGHAVQNRPRWTREPQLAGATAALVWAAQEPLDRQVFGCDYSDVALLGKAVSRTALADRRPPAPCRERRALRARLGGAVESPVGARARRERGALAADRARRPLPPRAGRGRAAAAPREQARHSPRRAGGTRSSAGCSAGSPANAAARRVRPRAPLRSCPACRGRSRATRSRRPLRTRAGSPALELAVDDDVERLLAALAWIAATLAASSSGASRIPSGLSLSAAQPSKRAARRSAGGLLPPIQIGIRSCTGLGFSSTPSTV